MRAIDADKVKIIYRGGFHDDYVVDYNSFINAPTIDIPTWIPCEERLPSERECPMDCIVTRKSKFIGNYVDMAVCESDGTWTHENWDAIVIDGEPKLINTKDDSIIAWMPLLQPYREDGE